MNIYISKKGYSIKPTDKESRGMNIERELLIKNVRNEVWKPYDISFFRLKGEIEKGKSFNPSIIESKINMLVFDVDGGVTEKEFLKDLKGFNMIPTIYYRTFSHDPENGKIKLRAIFKYNKSYTAEEHKQIYLMLMEYFPYLDPVFKSWKQLIHGTNTKVYYDKEESLFNPREFAKANQWSKQVEVKKAVKINIRSSNNSNFNLKGILEQHDLKTPKDYSEARDYFVTLKHFGLENELSLKEHHKGKFENLKDYKPSSDGAKMLFGQLKRLEETKHEK